MKVLGAIGLGLSVVCALIWLFFRPMIAAVGIVVGVVLMIEYVFNDDKKQAKMPFKYIAIYK